MDWLQTAASIFQIIGVVWIIAFGSKAIHEVIKLNKRPSSKTITNILLASILVVILFFVPVLRSLATSQPGSNPPHPIAPTQTLTTGNNPTVTGTALLGTTPTGIPTIGVTPSATAQPASGTYTFNHELSCDACANPIRVIITQVIIDPTNENMTWKLKLVNRIATDAIFNFDTFTLTDPSGNPYPGSSPWIHNDLNYYIPAGKTATGTVVIPLIPNKGVAYTLDVAVYMGSSNPVQFTPTPFTF